MGLLESKVASNNKLDLLEALGVDISSMKKSVELRLVNGVIAVVKSVSDDKFLIDVNPPLTGNLYSVSCDV